MESGEGQIPVAEQEVAPSYNVSLRPEVVRYIFGGVRKEYSRRLELMRSDQSSTPASFISEDIQASDEARLAREGANLLERAEKERLEKIDVSMTGSDAEILKRYLTATGPDGRLRAEMVREFDEAFNTARNTDRLNRLSKKIKSVIGR